MERFERLKNKKDFKLFQKKINSLFYYFDKKNKIKCKNVKILKKIAKNYKIIDFKNILNKIYNNCIFK